MAEDKAQAAAQGSNKLIIILMVVLLLAVLGLGGGMAYLLLRTPAAETGPGAPAAATAAEPAAVGPQLYFPMETFVVNFPSGSKVRFLQIDLQVAARDQALLDAVRDHAPAIRNDLVLLFSSQDPEALNTLEGKETLRAATLARIRAILEAQIGRGEVEDVYFTGFVMQ